MNKGGGRCKIDNGYSLAPLALRRVGLDNAGMLSIQQKFQFEVSEIPRTLNGIAHSGCTDRPKPPGVWLLFLLVGYKRAVLRTTILPSAKGHFGLTDRNDQTGQRGPPSKCSQIFRSDRTEMVIFIKFSSPKA